MLTQPPIKLIAFHFFILEKGFDLYSSLISAFTITMMIINLMGMMYWWDISLNAISLVNLVVVSWSFDQFR